MEEPSKDYLAGSGIAKWARAAAARIWTAGRLVGRRIVRTLGLSGLFSSFGTAPLQVLGLIVISGIAANLMFLSLLKQKIPLWGIGVRVALGILAGLGISARVSWAQLKTGSRVLRKS